MKKLKVLEHYTSTQGEGPHTGELTQFIRFAGCNMRCPGWPCDTPQAIFPDRWREIAVKKEFTRVLADCEDHPARNICLTGGEPTIQPEDELRQLIYALNDANYTVEMFSNGSHREFQSWELEETHIMMDWKLDGSGEAENGRSARTINAMRLGDRHGVKFVVVDENDLRQALVQSVALRNMGCQAQYWVAPAWGCITAEEVVAFMIEHGCHEWRLNIQTHKYIWHPDRQGV